MSEGWFSVPRVIVDSVVWTNSDFLKLWLLCTSKASYKDRPNNVWDGKIVPLKIGQFITGRDSLAEEFNQGVKKSSKVPPITLYKWLKKFETMQILNIDSTTKYSVVTMIDYESHRADEQQENNNGTTSEQQMNTNNKVNNLSSSPPPDITSNNINVHEEFENNFGRMLSPIELETINAWLYEDKYNPEVIQVALKEAVMNNAYSLKYIDRILLSWERKRIMTKSAALSSVQSRNERSVSQPKEPIEPEELPEVPMYDWVNQDKEPIQ